MKNTNTVQVGKWTVYVEGTVPARGGNGYGRRSQFADVWKSMKVGGHVLMTDKEQQSLATIVRNNQRKISIRTRDENERAYPDGQVMVYKVKECDNTKWFA